MSFYASSFFSFLGSLIHLSSLRRPTSSFRWRRWLKPTCSGQLILISRLSWSVNHLRMIDELLPVDLFEPFDISFIDMYVYSLCLSLQTHIRFTDVLRQYCVSLLDVVNHPLVQRCIALPPRMDPAKYIFLFMWCVLFILLFGRAIVHILFSYILQPCSETSLVSHSRRYQ